MIHYHGLPITPGSALVMAERIERHNAAPAYFQAGYADLI